MPSDSSILRNLDQAIAALLAVRAEIAAGSDQGDNVILVEQGNGQDPGDDFSEPNLLDTTSASARFGYPRDTIAGWCRDGPSWSS